MSRTVTLEDAPATTLSPDEKSPTIRDMGTASNPPPGTLPPTPSSTIPSALALTSCQYARLVRQLVETDELLDLSKDSRAAVACGMSYSTRDIEQCLVHSLYIRALSTSYTQDETERMATPGRVKEHT
ncbi:unnamed protein product [Zymoseptoria tritici ST99CH_1A5]|uniref:Uncharacterized protein n=1 Tax=Zymoseptoria tritici ST99CH_1A5 TaxID=1276529 RepID=A0A1Y6M1M9_ZYMTR|nr:unnamed protein product [Zymoseptoria tritici ST99CH_1A5]